MAHRKGKGRKNLNRTVILFLGFIVEEYQEIIADRERFLMLVSQADEAALFQHHKKGCPGNHRFTRHERRTRTLRPYQGDSYEITVWQVRCLDCQAVYTILPSFALRYKRLDAWAAQNLLEIILILINTYRGGRYILGLNHSSDCPIKDPRTLWHLVMWLGHQSLPAILRRLGLKPPTHAIEDEKFAKENGERTYIPMLVQGMLIWWIDYVDHSDNCTLGRSFQHFKAELDPPEDWKLIGVCVDGWLPAKIALQREFPGILIGECHLHALKSLDRALATYRKAHSEISEQRSQELRAAYEHVLDAPTRRHYGQRLRWLDATFKTDPILKPRYQALKERAAAFTAWTKDGRLAVMTTLLDQQCKFLKRKLFSMQTIRTPRGGKATVTAWAIARNFWRFLEGAKHAGQSPVELGGGDLHSIPWLQVVNVISSPRFSGKHPLQQAVALMPGYWESKEGSSAHNAPKAESRHPP
jgi:hypothetical protein